MAITVKDIQEKEFSIQAAEGYNPDQVFHCLGGWADIRDMQFIKHIGNPNGIRRNTDDIFAGGEKVKCAPDYRTFTGIISSAMRWAPIRDSRMALSRFLK